MGVPFGALDHGEMRGRAPVPPPAADDARREDDGRRRRARMGAGAAATSTRSSTLALRALAGGQLTDRDPNLLTLAALLADDLRRPRRGARASSTSRWSTRTAVARCSRSPACTCGAGFTLFWRGDLIDAEEELRASFDQAEAWGYGPDTLQWNAAHLSWCLTERGDLAERAQGADARPASAAAAPTARAIWCNARLELLVAEGRYEDAVEAARGVRASASPATTTPASARWSSLRAVALDALGMKRKAIELAAEELDRARDWGAPGTVARSLRVLGHARRRRGAGAARGGRRGRPAAPPSPAGAREVARRARRHAPPRRPAGLRPRAA